MACEYCKNKECVYINDQTGQWGLDFMKNFVCQQTKGNRKEKFHYCPICGKKLEDK